jgi:hypothetical protein
LRVADAKVADAKVAVAEPANRFGQRRTNHFHRKPIEESA